MRLPRASFIRQQGFEDRESTRLYQALMFQPRAVTVLVGVGAIVQSPIFFLGLGAALVLSAVVPDLNPFTAIYTRFVDRHASLETTPAPRRFAMGLAGAFSLAIATSLAFGAATTAWALEALLLAAASSVVFLRFCPGSFIYLQLTRAISRMRSISWARRLRARRRILLTPASAGTARHAQGARGDRP